MSEMVERVAQAMWEWQRSNCFIAGTIPVADLWPAWENAKEDSRETELGRAAAAIETIRNLPGHLAKLGAGEMPCGVSVQAEDFQRAWQAVIDEAVK